MKRSLLLLSLLLSPLACGPGADDPAGTGRVALALVAQGPEGVSYRPPPNASLAIIGLGTKSVSFIPLGGEETSRTAVLAPGQYVVEGHDSDDPADQLRTLLRGPALTPVPAVLQAQKPFTIIEGQTTMLVLRFVVQRVGDVSFRLGTASISVAVESSSAAGSRLALSGSYFVETQELAGDKDLVSLFSAAPETQVEQPILLSLPATWTVSDDDVCGETQGLAVAPAQPALGRMFAQVLKGTGEICFSRFPQPMMTVSLFAAPGDDDLFSLSMDGAPRSSPVQSFLLQAVYGLPVAAWDPPFLRLSAYAEERGVEASYVILKAASRDRAQRLSTTFRASKHKLQILPE